MTDNCVDNLEWCTVTENIHKSCITSGKDSVRNHCDCILTFRGQFVREFESINAASRYAAEKFGASYFGINRNLTSKNCKILKCNDYIKR